MLKFIFYFLFILFCSSLSFSQVNPDIKWRKITLDHFELIYDSEQQQLAELYASRLSGALQKLKPFFEQIPKKTTVVLNDQTDLTNGYATVLPYPMVMIFPVLPSAHETIGEFGDWANEIFMHEYTHILAMSQRRDTVETLENIFGSIMSPNLLLPRWWHEGLAVEMETRFSNHGRLRSTQQESWLRSYILSQSLDSINLAEANEVSQPDWPYGARPYLFGSVIWSELYAENSEFVKNLSWQHGGRVPYFVESPAQDKLGMSYSDYFEKAKTNLKQRAQKQITSLLKVTATESELIDLPYLDIESPQISPDGLKLAFIGKDDANKRTLQVLIRSSTQLPFDVHSIRKSAVGGDSESSSELKAPGPKDGPPGGTISGFSWHPQSQKIVYDLVSEIKTYKEVSELWIYDINSEKSEKIKNILRAREPAFSPDGKKIAYVGIQAGKTDLMIYDIEKAFTQNLIQSPLQARVSSPVFKDLNQIYFSYRENGIESLKIFDLSTNKSLLLKSNLTNPNIESMVDKKALLLADPNGVRNVYLTDFNKHQPLTHTLTGISGATLDQVSGDLYFTEQTATGLKLKKLAQAEKVKLNYPLPSTGGKIYADRYLAKPILISEKHFDSEDYSALPYLLPKYWFPFFYLNSTSSYFSIMTSGQDPLAKHIWNFYGLYDLSYGKMGYDVSYINQTMSAALLFDVLDQTTSFASGQTQRTQLAYSQISFPNSPLGTDWNFGLALTWLQNQDLTTQSTQAGPSVFLTYQDFSQSGAQVSPESGQGGNIRYTSYLPMNTTMTTYNKYDFSYVRYFSGILPKHHALMWKAQWSQIDRNITSANFLFSQAQATQPNSIYPTYLMRGYSSGTFQGRTFLQSTLEYRLPVTEIYKGSGTTPIYFKRVHGAIIVDGISLDGFAYEASSRFYRRVSQERNFWSTGIELKLDTTIGYHFPMTLYTGIYYPIDQSLTSGANFALGLFL